MRECEIVLPKFNPKQQLAFDSEATDMLFGGATRGGKSFFVRKALIVWCSQIPGLQCDIFRLNWDDVKSECMDGETSFPVLLANWAREGLVKINQTDLTFWNDSKIALEHASDVPQVKLKHQGISKHVRVFMEATQIDSGLIKWLSAWVTMSEEMKSRVPEKWKGRFPRIIHATNPIGPSAGYFRREYVDMRPAYAIEQVGAFKRQYIPALVEDNPHEDPTATRERVKAMGDAVIAKALLDANWHTTVGEFFPEFNKDRHVVYDFMPPAHWFRYRTFDWGTAEPFAAYWIAVSDGEPFRDSQGNQRWFPRGALIFYQEWYGCDLQDPSKGTRMRNEDIAAGIVARSEYGFEGSPTLADSKPFQDMGGEGIATTFAKHGCALTLADTSRVSGWSQMRSRFIGAEIDSNAGRVPMIFFCARCTYAQIYIPMLTRHPSENKKEDAAEHGEPTHCCDAIRYACMAHNVIRDIEVVGEARMQRDIRRTVRATPTVKAIIKERGEAFL